jgi:glycine cleavage system regulatory protein
MVPLVVTILGPYHPGIVTDVATVVADHGGHWNESRLVHLAGRFAGVVKVTVPEAEEAALLAELDAMEGVRILSERGGDEPEPEAVHQVEVTATDRPGIVRDVTAAVVACDGQIERFRTEYRPVPWGGGVTFYARLRVRVASVDALRAALQGIADDLLVDVRELPTP